MRAAHLKTSLILAAAIAPMALDVQRASADPKYLDVNDIATGSGVTGGATIALDNTSSNWDLDSLGEGAPTTLLTTDDAIVAAGTDATGLAFTLALGATAKSAATFTVEEGNATLTASADAGAFNVAGSTTIKTGARLNLASFSTTSGASARLGGAGNVVLDGGSLYNQSTITAGSFIAASKGLQVTANGGSVGVDDGVANGIGTGVVQLYTGTISGAGGTTSNGGVGTLTKVGADELRVQGATVPNFTFAKLNVKEGLYRIGNVAGSSELGFGALPTATLADAITLDGGSIGSSLGITINALRGITIGANGGTFENNSGSITVNSAVTSTGGTLFVQGRTTSTTSASYGQSLTSQSATLANVNNVTTFKGAVSVSSSILALSESLTATNLTGSALTVTGGTLVASATTVGQIGIASGKTFTVGTDDSSTNFAGRITGAGSFTKVGIGTLTLNTSNATSTSSATATPANTTTTQFTGEWTNTGGVNINGGTIKFGTGAAGFATACPVTIGPAGTLDMNNITDTFGPLSGTGQLLKGATGATLTISVATGLTPSFGGTISGGGALAKAGVGQQTITGTSSHTGATNVTAGTLVLNHAGGSALTATTGLSLVGTLTLGASDQVVDTATVTFSAGTLNTAGFDEALGVAGLTATSNINLGTGDSVLAFSGATPTFTAGALLKVLNYTGTPETGGGLDQLYFGTSQILTADQLSRIQFFSDASTQITGTTVQLSTGEVVVSVPEPMSLAALAGLSVFGIVRRRKA